MRAALVRQFGAPENVRVEDVPMPQARKGEAVVDIHAAAVNFPDVLFVANRYQATVELPFTPGSEYAGVVSTLGEGVTELKVGDRVRGSGSFGAFAEAIAAPVERLVKIPDPVDFASAASFLVAHATSFHSLKSVARVQPGEWVAVLGAAGGVGLAAVEIAKLFGARVIACARGDKLEACREAGADALIDYEKEDLKERIRALSGGGADVVIDPVGGRYAEPALRAMKNGGRFITVGYAAGEIPKIPINLLLLKGLSLIGFAMLPFGERYPKAMAENTAEMMNLLAAGKLRPRVSRTYPLEGVVDALKDVAERRAVGKILIRMRP